MIQLIEICLKIVLNFCMEIILSIIILIIAFIGLSIGVILDNKPLKGTCGGLKDFRECSICGGKPENCDDKTITPS
tara:strand:- start:424 stop:651 length:228 start_codon:yes stop_codon:yes gene_type:complete